MIPAIYALRSTPLEWTCAVSCCLMGYLTHARGLEFDCIGA